MAEPVDDRPWLRRIDERTVRLREPAYAVALNHDDTLLAVARGENPWKRARGVTVIDAVTGVEVAELPGVRQFGTMRWVTPTRMLVAHHVGARPPRLTVFELPDGGPIAERTLTGRAARHVELDLSDDGSRVLVSCEHSGHYAEPDLFALPYLDLVAEAIQLQCGKPSPGVHAVLHPEGREVCGQALLHRGGVGVVATEATRPVESRVLARSSYGWCQPVWVGQSAVVFDDAVFDSDARGVVVADARAVRDPVQIPLPPRSVADDRAIIGAASPDGDAVVVMHGPPSEASPFARRCALLRVSDLSLVPLRDDVFWARRILGVPAHLGGRHVPWVLDGAAVALVAGDNALELYGRDGRRLERVSLAAPSAKAWPLSLEALPTARRLCVLWTRGPGTVVDLVDLAPA